MGCFAFDLKIEYWQRASRWIASRCWILEAKSLKVDPFCFNLCSLSFKSCSLVSFACLGGETMQDEELLFCERGEYFTHALLRLLSKISKMANNFS